MMKDEAVERLRAFVREHGILPVADTLANFMLDPQDEEFKPPLIMGKPWPILGKLKAATDPGTLMWMLDEQVKKVRAAEQKANEMVGLYNQLLVKHDLTVAEIERIKKLVNARGYELTMTLPAQCFDVGTPYAITEVGKIRLELKRSFPDPADG